MDPMTLAILAGCAAVLPLALLLGLRWLAAGRYTDRVGRSRFIARSALMLAGSLACSILIAGFRGSLALPALPSLLLLAVVSRALVRRLVPGRVARQEEDGPGMP